MESALLKAEQLRDQINSTESTLAQLRAQLDTIETAIDPQAQLEQDEKATVACGLPSSIQSWGPKNSLTAPDYERYGRQMILPNFGVVGQLRLSQSKALVIGAGGLGCAAAMYLATAGIGSLHVMDGDYVELSNLHRQVLHTTHSLGMAKAQSAIEALKALNPRIHIVPIVRKFDTEWALCNMEGYDVVLDCTDKPSTRYMISDAALACRTPLITGAALRTDGQLLILNNPPARSTEAIPAGFCYRCVFPQAPSAAVTPTCSEAGVLGPVVGMMGVLMATEALNLLIYPLAAPSEAKSYMLIYSMHREIPFRSIRIKGKRAECNFCSLSSATLRSRLSSPPLYEKFCGMTPTTSSSQSTGLPRLSAQQLQTELNMFTPGPKLIDVRSTEEFGICHLEGSVNIPLASIEHDPECLAKHLDRTAQVVFLCRHGNDSSKAVQLVRDFDGASNVTDLAGGLMAWARDVDSTFPRY